MTRIGLAQANTLRSNNTSASGYGVAYADEVSGHRTVKTLAALYALHDWQLSASGDNTDSDAIGQLWYVVDADGEGNGNLYQLTNWEKRNGSEGWRQFGIDAEVDLTGYAKTEEVTTALDAKADKTDVEQNYVKSADLLPLSQEEINDLWEDS